jgi:cellulose biosynthesis protein BcsQ
MTEPGVCQLSRATTNQTQTTSHLEVVPAPRETSAFEVHQVLITQEGIRIGEAFVSEELAADGVYEFVFVDTPHRALGATAANNLVAAIGTPRPRPGRGRSN